MSPAATPAATLSPAPPTGRESTVVVVWPSIAAGPWGRWLGRLYQNRLGVRIAGVPITLGWIAVAITAPLAGLLYLVRKAPRRPLVVVGAVNPACIRYRVTDRRVLVEHPLERDAPPVAELPLAGFDTATLDVLPGQAWFPAADVVLSHAGEERLRLRGVPRPEPFVRTLLKTRAAFAPAGVTV